MDLLVDELLEFIHEDNDKKTGGVMQMLITSLPCFFYLTKKMAFLSHFNIPLAPNIITFIVAIGADFVDDFDGFFDGFIVIFISSAKQVNKLEREVSDCEKNNFKTL